MFNRQVGGRRSREVGESIWHVDGGEREGAGEPFSGSVEILAKANKQNQNIFSTFCCNLGERFWKVSRENWFLVNINNW